MPVRKSVCLGRERYVRNNENGEPALLAIDEDPSISIRAISWRFNTTKSTVQRILKENKLHAYHFTKVRNLLPQDYVRRIKEE
jgi:hypothetical protein